MHLRTPRVRGSVGLSRVDARICVDYYPLKTSQWFMVGLSGGVFVQLVWLGCLALCIMGGSWCVICLDVLVCWRLKG